jgi:hypothetical protein
MKSFTGRLAGYLLMLALIVAMTCCAPATSAPPYSILVRDAEKEIIQ